MENFDKFNVVVNHEGQYSIWPCEKGIPNGWLDVGVSGTREHCLQNIEEVWTDMRPRSLIQKLGEPV